MAISNHRLISADAVAFRWKDDRVKSADRQKTMRLATPEFIRRFLIHVLPLSRQIWLGQIACRAMDGCHRSRPYGLQASGTRKTNLAQIRALLHAQPPDQTDTKDTETDVTALMLREPCPYCGGPMRIIEIFRRGQKPMSRAPPRDQAA